jgi:hypothetical protein
MSYDLKPVYSIAESKLKISGETEIVKSIKKLNILNITEKWTNSRIVVGYVQSILRAEVNETIVVDGWYGEQTDAALNEYINGKQDWRSDLPDYEHIDDVYGSIDVVPRKIIQVTVPYTHYLAWDTDTSVKKISCHEKVADKYFAVLKDVLSAYGKDNIKKLNLDLFGGCYVSPPRKMRGGSKYSTHCWGIAFDYDPSNNRLQWGRDKAGFAKQDYDEWRAIWKEHGAVSLGLEKNYDWMHYQFAKL